jgi:hypothetical protein
MGRWQRREDAKNLSLIMAAGMAGALVTGGLMVGRTLSAHRTPREFRPAAVTVYRFDGGAPLTGDDRIYGRVRTIDGRDVTGFIRWDRNEGSWTDILDATKLGGRGAARLSGVRFGQIRGIQVQGPDRALLTLRSGQEVEMGADESDLGEGVRGILVDDADGGRSELTWDQVELVEFLPVPPGARPPEARLYGTLTTRSGQSFTGRIGWDMDEIYADDILDGDSHGHRQKVPFGAIARITQDGSRAARVLLRSGDEVTLDGTNDVNAENRGITVSDPALGQVKVDWSDFDALTFAEAPAGADAVRFDGGRPLSGTVVTQSGEELRGAVRWDDDEAATWEMLNGSAGGADFEVEFGQIARIEKIGRGALVTLKDGRQLELTGSNDVNDENNGIYVDTGNGVRKVSWEDFRELRLES